MHAPKLAIAAGNRLGAEAAANVARAGGNAVDACLASAVAGWVAEPFFASIGGSGFVAVGNPDGTVEVIDGNNTMPLTSPETPGQGLTRVFLDYSNGMYTGIGGGSVAVPGVLAAVRRAWERHGRIEWAALFVEAVRAAREGIAFPATSAYYITVTWEPIWSRYPETRAIFGRDDRPLEEGELLVQDELAAALELIAAEGPGVFYEGSMGLDIVERIAADGGFLGLGDLTGYKPEVRHPIATDAFGWRIESNPPPSVGGAVLVHLLALLEDAHFETPLERLAAIVEAQRAAALHRRERYRDPDEIATGLEQALAARAARRSPSTTHTSSADADGYLCSLTESNGYGAGLSVHGMLLNNTLGEEELNPLGIHGLPPGSRCHSNMAPTVARGPDRRIAIGSPGADRIVTAIAQALMRLAIDGDSLAEAVAAPRAHIDSRIDGELLCFEPGLPGLELGYTPVPYNQIHMYFGAVQAASVADDGTVDAAHDPRRSGGCALV